MKKLTRDTVFYAFSADLEPALEIEPGEKVQMRLALLRSLEEWSQ